MKEMKACQDNSCNNKKESSELNLEPMKSREWNPNRRRRESELLNTWTSVDKLRGTEKKEQLDFVRCSYVCNECEEQLETYPLGRSKIKAGKNLTRPINSFISTFKERDLQFTNEMAAKYCANNSSSPMLKEGKLKLRENQNNDNNSNLLLKCSRETESTTNRPQQQLESAIYEKKNVSKSYGRRNCKFGDQMKQFRSLRESSLVVVVAMSIIIISVLTFATASTLTSAQATFAGQAALDTGKLRLSRKSVGKRRHSAKQV